MHLALNSVQVLTGNGAMLKFTTLTQSRLRKWRCCILWTAQAMVKGWVNRWEQTQLLRWRSTESDQLWMF